MEKKEGKFRFIDLFAGIGGIRLGMESAGGVCVFSSEFDPNACKTYAANFGEIPSGDITKIKASEIPDFDVLCAGFPCQAFSIIGKREGFANETCGTLFFEIERILKVKRPKAFLLENVKNLTSHDKGNTFNVIKSHLESLGYKVFHKVMNALDYGVPQKRERIIITGFLGDADFTFPEPMPKSKRRKLSDILENDVPDKYYVKKSIRESRQMRVKPYNFPKPYISHENMSGSVTAHEYSSCLRASASANYILINDERRPTERELLRIQGFPDDFKIVLPYAHIKHQTGNSVAVPVISAVAKKMTEALEISSKMQNNIIKDKTRMKRIFISLPFTGHEDTLGERYDAAIKFVKSEHPEYDTLDAQYNIKDIIKKSQSIPAEQYGADMATDIKQIIADDAILMCKGWTRSHGCKLEYSAAVIYGKTVLFMEDAEAPDNFELCPVPGKKSGAEHEKCENTDISAEATTTVNSITVTDAVKNVCTYSVAYAPKITTAEIKIINKSDNPLPQYSDEESAGFDLRAWITGEPVVILPGNRALIKTGLFIELPVGLEGDIRPRSGLAMKHGITVLNTPGTIDSSYRGEIGVILANNGNSVFVVNNSDKIAQMVLLPYVKASFVPANQLSETERGTGGFGHSGIK